MSASSENWAEAEVEPVAGLPVASEPAVRGRMTYADRPVMRPEDDQLGRGPALAALEHLLSEPDEHGGLTVAIVGEPGCGKSSVMHMLRHRLAENAQVVWLDAWRHADPDRTLWRKLLVVLIEELGARGLAAPAQTEYRKAILRREIDELSACLMRSRRADRNGEAGGVSPEAIELAVTMSGLMGERWSAAELVQRLSSKELRDVVALLEYRRSARQREEFLALDELRARLHNLLSEELSAHGRRLYVFVDHLDRCRPDQALEGLEALRSFCELPGIALVLALDPGAMELERRARLGEGVGKDGSPATDSPLAQLIDVPFSLPPPGPPQLETFVRHWCEARGSEAIARAAPAVAAGSSPNPRRIKRTLVALGLLEQLGQGLHLGLLAKLLVLKSSHRDQFRAVRAEPSRLRELERQAREAVSQATEGRPATPQHRREAMLALEPWFEPLPEQQLAWLVASSDGIA